MLGLHRTRTCRTVSRNTLVTCDIAMCPPPPEEHFVTDPRDLHAREDVSHYAPEVRNSSHIHTVCACHGVSNLYMKTHSSPDSPKLQPHVSNPSSFLPFISSTRPFPNRIGDELATSPTEPSCFPHTTPKPSQYLLLISRLRRPSSRTR